MFFILPPSLFTFLARVRVGLRDRGDPLLGGQVAGVGFGDGFHVAGFRLAHVAVLDVRREVRAVVGVRGEERRAAPLRLAAGRVENAARHGWLLSRLPNTACNPRAAGPLMRRSAGGGTRGTPAA